MLASRSPLGSSRRRTVIRRTPLLAVLVLALACLLRPGSGRAEVKKDKAPGDEIKLFNGKNLDGWKIFVDPKFKDVTPEDVWSVKDSVIHCKGKPFGYLITENEYGDYVLTVEWRWPEKPGNSGVFVHVSGKDQIWPKGVEAQLFHQNAGDFWLVGDFKLKVDKERQDKRTPRHFNRMNKEQAVEKAPGEWNRYEITCKGDTIKLVVNGKMVNEGTDAEATRGKILLQSEGAPIEFRNIKLKSLK
jgi:hypothetical protein